MRRDAAAHARSGAMVALVAFGAISPGLRVDASPRAAACPPGSVLVPAGRFPIGTTPAQGFDADERPRHTVTLTTSYCIDLVETTVGAYERCVAAGGCLPVQPAFAIPTYPMTNVTWF